MNKRKNNDENWNEQIFGVNQLFFSIFSCLQFPSSLPLASVHTTWCLRIWPSSVSAKILCIRSKGRKCSKAKLQRVHRDVQDFIPSVPVFRNATSQYAVLDVHCAKFTTLPVQSYRNRPVLLQLFTTYPHIETVEIHGPLCHFRIKQLLKAWNECPGKLKTPIKKHLKLINCHTSKCYSYVSSISVSCLTIEEHPGEFGELFGPSYLYNFDFHTWSMIRQQKQLIFNLVAVPSINLRHVSSLFKCLRECDTEELTVQVNHLFSDGTENQGVLVNDWYARRTIDMDLQRHFSKLKKLTLLVNHIDKRSRRILASYHWFNLHNWSETLKELHLSETLRNNINQQSFVFKNIDLKVYYV